MGTGDGPAALVQEDEQVALVLYHITVAANRMPVETDKPDYLNRKSDKRRLPFRQPGVHPEQFRFQPHGGDTVGQDQHGIE